VWIKHDTQASHFLLYIGFPPRKTKEAYPSKNQESRRRSQGVACMQEPPACADHLFSSPSDEGLLQKPAP